MLVVVVAAGLTGRRRPGRHLRVRRRRALRPVLDTPFGLSALTYALVGYAVGLVGSALERTSGWWPVGMAAAAGAVQAIAVHVARQPARRRLPVRRPAGHRRCHGAWCAAAWCSPPMRVAVVGARAQRARPAGGGAPMSTPVRPMRQGTRAAAAAVDHRHRGGRAVRVAVRPALRPPGASGPTATRCRPRPTGCARCSSPRPGAASSTATARSSSTTAWPSSWRSSERGSRR